MWAEETQWAAHADWAKDRLVACQESDPASTQNPCHQFVAEALEQVYSVTDFKNGGEYLRPSQIAELVSESADWIEIGPGSDQQALVTAQERANEGIASDNSVQIEVHEEDCLTMNDLDLTLEFLSCEILLGSQAIQG